MDLTDFFGGGESGSAQLPTKVRKQAHQQVTSMMPGVDEFDGIQWQDGGVIDHVLQGRSIEGSETTALQNLTDLGRKSNALKLPVKAGTRVEFLANLGSVLAYKDIPGDKMAGSVVTVRSADGDITAFGPSVHVMWDDGQFRAINAEHLRLTTAKRAKQASAVRIGYFGGMGDISSFFQQAKVGSNDLIHKATKDLWAFREEADGFVIERLFDETGGPLKG